MPGTFAGTSNNRQGCLLSAGGRRLRNLLLSGLKKIISRLLNRYGYTITKTGLDFIDAKSFIAAARKKGLSVPEYWESLRDDPRKVGRRDLIIGKLQAAGILDGVSTVCEIGTGTGQYLEKVIGLAQPEIYEVYETDRGWVQFLKSEYGGLNGLKLICHPADGNNLRYTHSDSVDLVHAHGVFVYLPLLQTMEYLKECVRVCREGGHIVFDCFLGRTFFSLSVVEDWLAGPHRFPVVIPEKLLDEFARINNLRALQSFSVTYGSGSVDYLIWQKSEKG
jgi:SAM-dependent methyltransferase